MASKRIETSKHRLFEKIEEGKKYLREKENSYEINELTRLRNNIAKKKGQFEKDIQDYEKIENRDEDKIIEYQDFQVDAEDILDDIEHYIETTKEQLAMEKEAADKQQEAEEKRREQEYQLERLRIESEVSKEKCKAEIAVAAADKKTTSKQQTVRLPKLELKKFNGDLLKWQSFWDSFDSTIHNNDSLHNIDKLNYLRSQLQGDALKTIAGLESTNSNYTVAIDILKERYGNQQLIIQNHYTKLADLEAASDRIHSLRSVFDTIEQHLRSLEALGEDINHQQYVTTIIRKFPARVNEHITHHNKAPEEAWTVKKLRKAIQNYIVTKEIAAQQQPSSSGRDSRRNDYRDEPTGTMFANTGQRILKCIFCGKRHWSDECRTVSSLKERKEKLKGKCFICLRDRHQGKCKKEKPCYHCKKTSHHRSLCPSHAKGKQRSTENGMVADDEENNQEETLIEEEGLLSAGENVIMQTSLVEAMDGEESCSE
ncbi:MAG: DUF1759 domain-containing protein, partial [Bacteroidota bacterium]